MKNCSATYSPLNKKKGTFDNCGQLLYKTRNLMFNSLRCKYNQMWLNKEDYKLGLQYAF